MPSDGTWNMTGFKNTTVDVPIPLEDLEKEYCRLTSQPYPIPEMVFVRSWMLFRVSLERFLVSNIDDPSIQLSVISQGIAARYARRQASSEQAHIHVHGFPIVGALAKKILEDEGISVMNAKAKL